MIKKIISITIILNLFNTHYAVYGDVGCLAVPGVRNYSEAVLTGELEKDSILQLMLDRNRNLTNREKEKINSFVNEVLYTQPYNLFPVLVRFLYEEYFSGRYKKIPSLIKYMSNLKQSPPDVVYKQKDMKYLKTVFEETYRYLWILSVLERLTIKVENGQLDIEGIKEEITRLCDMEFWEQDEFDEESAGRISGIIAKAKSLLEAALASHDIVLTANYYLDGIKKILLADKNWKNAVIKPFIQEPIFIIFEYVASIANEGVFPGALSPGPEQYVRPGQIQFALSEMNAYKKYVESYDYDVLADIINGYIALMIQLLEEDFAVYGYLSRTEARMKAEEVVCKDYQTTGEALYLMLQNREWREVFNEVRVLEIDNTFTRQKKDLEIFLHYHNILPPSGLRRDWERNGMFPERLLEQYPEFHVNHERIGIMLENYATWYRKLMREYSHATHEEVISIMRRENMKYVRRETDVSSQNAQNIQRIAEQMFKQEYDHAINEIYRISFVLYLFEVLHFQNLYGEDFDYDVLYSLRPKVPITIDQHKLFEIIEEPICIAINANTCGEIEHESVVRDVLIKVNEALPKDEKFNVNIDLSMIPDYEVLKSHSLTDEQWLSVITGYIKDTKHVTKIDPVLVEAFKKSL